MNSERQKENKTVKILRQFIFPPKKMFSNVSANV